MSTRCTPHEGFGRTVIGPVLAEFCLNLWAFAASLERPDDAALLFCARGGLRLQLAYDRFCARSGLESPAVSRPLMVSRLAAVRPSLVQVADAGHDGLLPGAAAALSYEFSHLSLARATEAISGVRPGGPSSDRPFASDDLAALLRAPEGRAVTAALREQSALFGRHLREVLGQRHHAALVDTGLYGTTRQLLAEGFPDLKVSSPLLARSFRPGSGDPRAFGLSVEAEGYDPRRRRTALLRYWHFVEWLLEPELASVRTFTDDGGRVRSNLEVDGWRRRVEPHPGSVLAGAMTYLDALGTDAGAQIVADSDRAWSELHRSVVRPRPPDVALLAVGVRSHDFGLEGTWSARSWRGPIATLRGSSMWREGEAAMAGPLRRPLLLALETAYSARWVRRSVLGRGTPTRRSSTKSRDSGPSGAEKDR